MLFLVFFFFISLRKQRQPPQQQCPSIILHYLLQTNPKIQFFVKLKLKNYQLIQSIIFTNDHDCCMLISTDLLNPFILFRLPCLRSKLLSHQVTFTLGLIEYKIVKKNKVLNKIKENELVVVVVVVRYKDGYYK